MSPCYGRSETEFQLGVRGAPRVDGRRLHIGSRRCEARGTKLGNIEFVEQIAEINAEPSAISAGAAAGLFWLADATGPALLAAATLYGIGKSFFWGTSLAIASERFPKGGAVTVNVMAGAGMLAAGIVGSILLGTMQDRSTASALAAHDNANGTQLVTTYLAAPRQSVFGDYRGLDTAALERAPVADRATVERIVAQGKKSALRDVAVLPVLMLLAYLALILMFRRRGGYRPVQLAIAGDAA